MILPSGLGYHSANATVASSRLPLGSTSTRGGAFSPSATYSTLWSCVPSLRR